MKRNIFAGSLILFLAGAALTRAVDDVPKQPSFSRYEAMMNRSPFAVATAVAAPASTPNFAKDLYIANAARLVDEGVVTLTSSTDKNLKEYLSTKSPNLHGYSISNIEWSDRVGATKVTIGKDGQFATLTFNQALLSQAVPNQLPQPQFQPQPQPQQQAQAIAAQSMVPIQSNANGIKPPPVQPPQIQPAPIPMLPTPPPRVRGVIQRNPLSATQSMQVQPEKDKEADQ